MEKLSADYIKQVPNKINLELRFSKVHLPGITLSICLLALMALSLLKNFKIGLALGFVAFLLQLILITLRIFISGRAPITNMYETVLFSGFGALILSLIIGHVKKEKFYVFVGLCYNCCTLMMLNFATGMLSASIGPLVPVLRDNFWLSTHVTCVILSYGALALSWVMANIALIKKKFFVLSSSEEENYAQQIYTCIKFGTILLATGIILGGIWADYSWGRFWGWDPKETWSAIVLMIYIGILHGKYTSWINRERFIPLVALAFLSVMMAWFGVNYILAAGLHSYGFSQGGAVFLTTVFLAQFAILAITFTRIKAK